jgi:hypothetical protein
MVSVLVTALVPDNHPRLGAAFIVASWPITMALGTWRREVDRAPEGSNLNGLRVSNRLELLYYRYRRAVHFLIFSVWHPLIKRRRMMGEM